ncbi:MAG: APC family permease [Myxococcales bacterium]|nr:MAG: APC family permease [Myxococcales bacterium]
MIGAGVFAAFGPAARAAGSGLLLGLVLAALVAYCNATSSAQLAALYPESGGTYVYGRKRLGAFWGYLAGWCFVVGKLASCAAMAMTFGGYASPTLARPCAVVVVIALTALNYTGIQKTLALTKVLLGGVLLALTAVVACVWLGGEADPARLASFAGVTAWGVARSAGFLFFAFAGYARLATLGEEVIEPARTIPRAIPLALSITLVIYAVVGVSVLAGVDARDLAASAAPLATAVEAGRFASLSSVVRLGATLASLGVLLSLIVGVSRTAFAMAVGGDLPSFFAAVHPRFRVPHRAEVAVGVVVVAVVMVADVRGAIGFSSFAVLLYYAIANAAAWTLRAHERRWPRALAALGLVGCIGLAAALPTSSVGGGVVVLGLGALAYALRYSRHGDGAPPSG